MASIRAERDCFEPPRRSSPARTSRESVIDVFSFILPISYHESGGHLAWPELTQNFIGYNSTDTHFGSVALPSSLRDLRVRLGF